VKLDPNTINELVVLLKQFMEDERNRRPFLVLALGNDAPVLQRITWSGAVAAFIPDMVCKLADYGEIAPGRQALWALLEYVRSQAGVDVQQRIDKLRPLIDLRSPLALGFAQSHSDAATDTSSCVETLDIDVLVQKVRSRIHNKIQQWHGTIPLWDVARPVEISRLYVDVNILTEPTSYSRLEIQDLLSDCDYQRDFNRFGLSEKGERVAGLRAVVDYPKLMVLGKPGAGKTTFLQHVVIECNNGNLLADRVPILIKLREFVGDAREIGDFSLGRYISSCLRGCSQEEIETLLEQGKVLLLLDGLDEVPGADGDAVVRQIESFVRNYDQTQLIITCRIQAQKYRFKHFAYVEVADFNSEQIAKFVKKWFVTTARNGQNEGQARARQFLEKLNLPENKQIRELTVTPILLSLTCKVFCDTCKFYSKPAELYEQGLEILLSKWDEAKGTERNQVYGKLTLGQKQSLLSYVAARKFEQNQYVLFEQREIQGYIAEYPDISPEDSQAVLESIEAQHGLLVERAKRIYSFSHLTFQEYFTAKRFCDRADWNALVNHITEKHWREVFLLAVGMLSNADDLLKLMKEKVDGLVAEERNLQQLLVWVRQRSLSLEVPYKAAAVRAFYLNIDLDMGPDRPLGCAIDRIGTYVLACASLLSRALRQDNLSTDTITTAKNIVEPDRNYYLGSQPIFALANARDRAIAYLLDTQSAPELIEELQKLRQELQRNQEELKVTLSDNNEDNLEIWFNYRSHNKKQTELVQIITMLLLEHKFCKDCKDRQFSKQQQELLQQYYDANKLLVDCLNSGCVVSDRVREEIEETLLLPIAEIENRRGTRADL
jgi:predicted NACHT family NTPase